MTSRPEVLVFCCGGDDLAVLQTASGSLGPTLRTVESAAELARQAVTGGAAAVVIGIGEETLANLSIVTVVRAIRVDLPVIVVAEEDSLELEKGARQAGIFYYLVHPIEKSEVEAVLTAALKRVG
jgi:DNA-binding response OmpR family regulator